MSDPTGPVTLGDLVRDDKLLWVYCCDCYHRSPEPRLETDRRSLVAVIGAVRRRPWRCLKKNANFSTSRQPKQKPRGYLEVKRAASEKKERRRGLPALKVVCSGVRTAVGAEEPCLRREL